MLYIKNQEDTNRAKIHCILGLIRVKIKSIQSYLNFHAVIRFAIENKKLSKIVKKILKNTGT